LQKAFHIAVVSIFGLAAALSIFDGFSQAWHIGTVTGPYFPSEMSVLNGVALFLACVGAYRFDRRVRPFAIILAALEWVSFAAVVLEMPRLTFLLTASWITWLAIWSLVLCWLWSPEVRRQFAATAGEAEVA
jgi:hypothetical protein